MQTHLLKHNASLSKIRRLIRTDLVRAGAAPSAVFDCLVAVSEACASSLDGAGDDDVTKISWTVTRAQADFRIEGFRHHPGPELRRKLKDALGENVVGPAGENMIENLMDEVVFDEGDPGVLRMRKRLH